MFMECVIGVTSHASTVMAHNNSNAYNAITCTTYTMDNATLSAQLLPIWQYQLTGSASNVHGDVLHVLVVPHAYCVLVVSILVMEYA